ncbi:hypothetical protein SLA2020_007550 [Shorea laevis]
MAVNPLGLSLSPQTKLCLCFGYSRNLKLGVRRSDFWNIRRRGILLPKRRHSVAEKAAFCCRNGGILLPKRWHSVAETAAFLSLMTSELNRLWLTR